MTADGDDQKETVRRAYWLGGGATMLWSHADAATYRRWIEQAGLTVTEQDFVPEGTSGHALFWATR